MHCSDISRIGRNTKGVRLMRLKDGAVATIALTARDEEEAAEELIEAAPELPAVPAAIETEEVGTGVEDFEEEIPAEDGTDEEI